MQVDRPQESRWIRASSPPGETDFSRASRRSQDVKMESIEMKNIARRDVRLLVDALFLFTRLVEMTVQADEVGELHEGHRLLRITSKARARYLRIRSEFHCERE